MSKVLSREYLVKEIWNDYGGGDEGAIYNDSQPNEYEHALVSKAYNGSIISP